MEFTYDNIVKWMKEYFSVFSEYGQDPATFQRMNDYFTPDFEFVGYVGAPQGPKVMPSRDDFLQFDISHPSSYERLTPEDFTVDERRKVVVVIIKFEAVERATGKVLAQERGISHYQFVTDENNTIKIKRLLFFPERVPPGTLTVADIFARDAK